MGAGPLSETLLALERLGVDVRTWTVEDFKALSQFMQEERRLTVESTLALEQQADMRRSAARQAELNDREARVRFVLALLLVVGVVAGVFVGILRGLEADATIQYLAPIAGLAGIAIGYFFGRVSREGDR